MFRCLLKNVSKVFSFGSGKREQNAYVNAYGFSNKNGVETSDSYRSSTAYDMHLSGAGINLITDPKLIFQVSKACGKLLSFLMAQVTSKKVKVTCKESLDGLEETVGTSSSTNVLKDEGYQSALDCIQSTFNLQSTCKQVENSLLMMEESYKQQIRDLEYELELQYKLMENYDIKNKRMDDEDELEGKGKGGKGYVKKMCSLEEEQLILKDQYLSKIKSENKYLRFHQMDEETQLMICKIDALRESGMGNNFYDELLRMFEEKSMELVKLKTTVKKMKELEGDFEKTIDELVDEHQEIVEEKDQEIKCLKKKLQKVLVGKVKRDYSGEPIRNKNGRVEFEVEDFDDECKQMIANIEALRESDNILYDKVLHMLEGQNKKVY